MMDADERKDQRTSVRSSTRVRDFEVVWTYQLRERREKED